MVEAAQTIKNLPPYLFARIEKLIAEAKAAGKDVISLGIGDPDRPTPPHIIAKLIEQAQNQVNHQYPSSVGLLEFREAVAAWYKKRFNLKIDPEKEVVSLLGSKEGIAHISFCYLNPGDLSLVPDPAYPVYAIGALLGNARSYPLPLLPERGFLPDLQAIPENIAREAKLMFLNYPNNPTGATADLNFFREVVAFARKYDILVCHDAAYSEVYFDGKAPVSFLQAEGAKDVGIEFHSVSKTYNMTGWRIGWAAGNAKAIDVLGRFKSNIDSGVFQAIQHAGITALTDSQECVTEMRQVYQERRDVVMAGLKKMGWDIAPPPATIYVWAPVPKGYTSSSFAELILEKTAVVITPGLGYGERSDGYFRIALTQEVPRIQEALERMQAALGVMEF